MSLMISVSGIRGIVGDSVKPSDIVRFISAFLSSIPDKSNSIALGRDTRVTGEAIESIATGTLIWAGKDVYSIGVCTTPTLLYYTGHTDADGGIMVTASHNPPEWNALKFCNSNGIFLSQVDIKKIKDSLQKDDFGKRLWKNYRSFGKRIDSRNALDMHIQGVLSTINVEKIKKKKFKVVVDPGGGASGDIDKKLLHMLNCELIMINEKPGISFPRAPEPVPENLKTLEKVVKEQSADIGFAQDPDGDRLSIVDERGIAIGEEYTLAICGESHLRKRKTDIVCNLSTSSMIDHLAKRYGVKVYRTKIGEINVTEKLLEIGADFGGEGNGGVIIPSINPCRDSMVGIALILQLMAEEEKPISYYTSLFPRCSMIKEKIKINDYLPEPPASTDFYNILEKLIKKELNASSISTLDGVKVNIGDEWIHIRMSNTEPIIRLFSEAHTSERAQWFIEKGKTLVRTAMNKIKGC